MMYFMSLHPSLEPVVHLVGTWRGTGQGEYPTIDSFEYTEEVTFTDVGKPFLVYTQRTWSLEGRPLHVETGYLRVVKYEAVEFVLAQPTGQSELAEGTHLAMTMFDTATAIDLGQAATDAGRAALLAESAALLLRAPDRAEAAQARFTAALGHDPANRAALAGLAAVASLRGDAPSER